MPAKQKMALSLKSLVESAKQSISGASTPAPRTSGENTPIDALFRKVDPSVDGEDCDHDCDSCHINYPRKFKIDEEDQLYGFVKGWSTHVLVATGKTDWVRDVADEKGSLMEAIEKKADVKISNGVISSPPPQKSWEYTNSQSRNSCYQPRIYRHQTTPHPTPNQQQSSSSPPS